MRILLMHDDLDAQGGAALVVQQLAQGYRNAGHTVELLTAKKQYRPSLRSILSIWNPKATKQVTQFFKKHGEFDAVHAHNVHAHLTYHALKIAKRHTKKLVITFHDVMSVSYGRLASQKYLQKLDRKLTPFDHIKQAGVLWNPLRNMLIKRALNNAHVKVAVSTALKEVLEANGIAIDQVIHNGISISPPTQGERLRSKWHLQGKQVIFFGGRLRKDKGFAQLLNAYRMIKNAHPHVAILVAGERAQAERLLAEYPHGQELKTHLVITGWLEREELLSALSISDICVTPSVCFDSFPTVNLEAMALEKPVIATCYGGSKELVEDNVTGFIVNPFATEHFAQRLGELLADPQRAELMGKAGKRRVESAFGLFKQIQSYEALFSS